MSQLINLGDPNLRNVVQSLRPTRGYCVMADIVGSTALKKRGVGEWVIRIANTFNNVRSWVEPQILKVVGDMVMFWFPDSQFHSTTSPLTLLQGLWDLHSHPVEWAEPVRVAVSRCVEAYEITFLKAGEDVYGKEIDLTARLLGLAQSGETIIDLPFYEVVIDQYARYSNRNDFEVVEKIEGPIDVDVKGFTDKVRYYKVPRPR